MRYLLHFVRAEGAATAVEYAVMLALILISVIGAIGSFGGETGRLWGGSNNELEKVGFIK